MLWNSGSAAYSALVMSTMDPLVLADLLAVAGERGQRLELP
jgi:hypothetical protein